ncbi:unnamed protein product [Linum tenue]|uniref:Uncharacterized protein n=1 Tax=Linum tenue TaxID=586396 RepID=A0AAV0QS02_9ROSI|nr:unnamed protein product [Linum tenue]
MATKTSHLFLLFVVVLGALIEGTTCRRLLDGETTTSSWGEKEAVLQGSKKESSFMEGASAIRKSLEEWSKNKSHKIRTVSRRLVPCGPNLLHN